MTREIKMQKINLILRTLRRSMKQLFWQFPRLLVFEFRRNKKFRLRVMYGMLIVVLFLISPQISYWYRQFKLRTHFTKEQTDILAVSEEIAEKNIDGKCNEIRKGADRMYGMQEIASAVLGASGEKITLVGKDNESPAPIRGVELPTDKTDSIAMDISGKNVELLCFNFTKRIVSRGEGNLEIGNSEFVGIDGNSLTLSGGKGKIYQNIIEGSGKAGIFADSGQWEISGNIIKNNLSYGVYGGYGASLKLKENFISGNGGYQVRMMDKREVYR